MCGFVGFVDPDKKIVNPGAVLRAASARISRRGPDAESFWTEGAVHLAHRRLAIVDLSPSGLQPMASSDGRYVILFNGEIYNHEEMRQAFGLRDVVWRGHSDTEVLIEHIRVYGLRHTLETARGMFAIALWDRQEMTMSLARDRLGEKPLFFGWLDGTFVFGSELKVLKAFEKKPRVHEEAVAQYLRYGYIPAPLTIFEGFEKVLPGTFLRFSYNDIKQRTVQAIQSYWTLEDAQEVGERRYGAMDFEQKALLLEKELKASVQEQLVADVPVGALLSGGIDSSLVVALAQSVSPRAVKTFTIGFKDPKYDEAPFARAVAEHLGTEHRELYIGEEDLLGLVQAMPDVYDEPFADASQVPMLLVSKLVRKHVTVCLSGDGGDELFRGYERYLKGGHLWSRVSRVPAFARRAGAGLLTMFSPSQLDALLAPLRKKGITGDRIHKASAFLGADSAADFYDGLAQLPGGLRLIRPEHRPSALTVESWSDAAFTAYASRWDSRYYLPDDILVKVDRAAMYESLETRVPLLRPEILEIAWSSGEREHVRGTVGKQLLRRVLGKHVPMSLFDRPKQGFGVPMDVWLRGPLKDWAAEQLLAVTTCKLRCVDSATLSRMWDEHQAGQRNWSLALWAVCMLGAFLKGYAE